MMYWGIRIEERKGYLFIEKQWNKSTGRTSLFTASFFIIIASLFIARALFLFIQFPSSDLSEISYLGALFLAIGLFFAYIAFAHFWNTTKIRLDNKTLQISYSPVFFPSKHFAVETIHQIHLREQHQRFRVSYSLWLSLYNKPEALLLDKFLAAHHALDVKQAIERYLGIEDKQAKGESQ